MEDEVGCTVMEEPSVGFILNMTSDAKVRSILEKVKLLSEKTTEPPEMNWYDAEFDPSECPGPFLPFSVYLITGTAGAGKSTSISSLYQSVNCLITGATTVAAQNLSKRLKTYCPTIFNAFGFKSRHINILTRSPPRGQWTSIDHLQHYELDKYWPIISDICKEIRKKKKSGQYSNISNAAFNMLCKMGSPSLWTTNVIVIDEAGTLSSHILSTVVFFYWFYNSWLNTPLYRAGKVPCIVCVGSPTQTDAFQSTYNHIQQRHHISACDNVLSLLITNKILADYIDLNNNWALFINNKRCTDPEFGHMLKLLEYNLPIPDDTMNYIDRFIVPRSKILNPLEYIGWTRLFLSHNEVKAYLSSLHTALAAATNTTGAKLFTCPIVCEIFTGAFQKYKSHVNLDTLTPTEWLNKNLFRLSNYSQFIDQDMTIVSTETSEDSLKITYVTKYVKDSYVSLNGKTKKSTCGFMGPYESFKKVLECETFIDTHAHDQPEFVYSFLNILLYNGMYSFYNQGVKEKNIDYLSKLNQIPIPSNISTPGTTKSDDISDSPEENIEEDRFYYMVQPPPTANAAPLPVLIGYYNALKEIFLLRLSLAIESFGTSFLQKNFVTFTINICIRDGVELTSDATHLFGLLDYASTVESYKLKGYTFLPVNFGRYAGVELSKDLKNKMPNIVVEDSLGFISCLENNVNKLTETLEDGSVFHLCSAGDYGLSSKLAMTIVKAQGISLDKVAISFGNHKNIKLSHVYVAISRATDPECLVIDCNPLKHIPPSTDQNSSSHIVKALHNPKTLLVY
nr:helicase [Bovine gammaherpesvirus 4]